MREQRGAALRPYPADFLEPALLARFLATLAMSGDGEAVRFVAHALDQMQRSGFGPGPQGFAIVAANQGLVPGTALGALGDADDEHTAHAKIGQYFERLRDL